MPLFGSKKTPAYQPIATDIPDAPPPQSSPNPKSAQGHLVGKSVRFADSPNLALRPSTPERPVGANWRPLVADVPSPLNISPTSLMVLEMAGIKMYPNGLERKAVEDYMELAIPRTDKKTREAIDTVYSNFRSLYTQQYGREVLIWRKAKFYEEAVKAIEKEGFDQVLLFADGVNPMVCALAKTHVDTQFYCTDVNAKMMEQKQKIMDVLGLHNVHCIALDATKPNDYQAILEQHGWSKEKKTYAQAEGLVYYIPKEAESELFAGFTSLHPDNVLLIDNYSHEAVHAPSAKGVAHRDFCTACEKVLNLPIKYRYHKDYELQRSNPDLNVREVRRILDKPVDDPFYKESVFLSDSFTLETHEIYARKDNLV